MLSRLSFIFGAFSPSTIRFGAVVLAVNLLLITLNVIGMIARVKSKAYRHFHGCFIKAHVFAIFFCAGFFGLEIFTISMVELLKTGYLPEKIALSTWFNNVFLALMLCVSFLFYLFYPTDKPNVCDTCSTYGCEKCTLTHVRNK